MRAMPLLSVLGLTVLSTAARAGNPYATYAFEASSVTLESDVVELPIYAFADDGRVLVVGTFGSGESADDSEADADATPKAPDTGLIELLTGSRGTLNEATTGRLGLKVHAHNKKLINWMGGANDEESVAYRRGVVVKTATLPELRLGGLVIQDARMWTGDPDDAEVNLETQPRIVWSSLPAVDATIPLPMLEGIAWAIDRTAGVVRFTAASNAAALTGPLGSTGLAVTSVEATTAERSPLVKHRPPFISAYPMVVPAEVAGSPVQAALSQWLTNGTVSTVVQIDSSLPVQADGEVHWVRTPVTLGGVATTGWNRQTSDLDYMLNEVAPLQAVLARDVLGHLDLASDPAGQQLYVRAATGNVYLDPTSWLLDRAQAQVAAAEAKLKSGDTDPAKADADADTAESDKKDIDTKLLLALADAQSNAQKWDDAIATRKRILENDHETSCLSWANLGTTLEAAGRYDEAVEPLTKAAALYKEWWDRPLDEREDLNKAYDKMEKDEQQAADYHPQSSKCFTAAGKLAMVNVERGDFAQAGEVYKTYLDLDPKLASAQAVGLLAQSKWNEVQEPVRQTTLLRHSKIDPNSAYRLSYVEAQTGRWSTAAARFDEVVRTYHNSDVAMLGITDLVAAQAGDAAALDLAKAWAKGEPDAFGAQLALLRSAMRSGDAATVETTKATLAKLMAVGNNGYDNASRLGNSARYKAVIGDNAGAKADAMASLALFARDTSALMALGEVAKAEGDMALANAWFKKAAQAAPTNPGMIQYLPLLGTATAQVVPAAMPTATAVAPAPTPAATPAPAPAPSDKAGSGAPSPTSTPAPQ